MTVVDTLTVNISAATQAFEKGMKSARNSLGRFAAAAGKASIAVAAMGTAATAAIGGIAVAATRDFARFGDELDKLSKRVNISVETLSGLKFAAEQSGTNIDSLGQALFRMQRRIANASTETGPAVRALKELGIEARELTKRTSEEQFFEVVAALNEIENEARAGQLAFEIFGDNARQLVPLLEENEKGIRALIDEAKELGIVLSQDDAESAAALTDAMNRLKSSFRGASLSIGRELAPGITALANGLTKLTGPVKNALEAMKPVFASVFSALAEGLALAIDALNKSIETFFKARIRILEFARSINRLSATTTRARTLTGELKTERIFTPEQKIREQEFNRAIEEQTRALDDFRKSDFAQSLRDLAAALRGEAPRFTGEVIENRPPTPEEMERDARRSFNATLGFFKSIAGLRRAIALPELPGPTRVQVAQATLAGSREAIEARIRHQLRRESPEKTEEQMLIQLKELVKLARERGGAVIEEIGGFVT